VVHLGPRISHNPDIFREELVPVQSKQRGVSLLLGQITRGTKDDNDSVVLELQSPASVQSGQQMNSSPKLPAEAEVVLVPLVDLVGGKKKSRGVWWGQSSTYEAGL
jgi:hypothetical protein